MRISSIALASTLVMWTACTAEQPPPAEKPVQAVEEPTKEIVEARVLELKPVDPSEQPEQPEQPKTPPPELPPLDKSCKADDECTPAPGCCPVPCTSNVINRGALEEARRRLEELCPKDRQCQSAGSCRAHEYLCVEGSCAIAYEGDKHYRKRKSHQ